MLCDAWGGTLMLTLFRFTFSPLEGFDGLPIYSGKILINSSLGESLSVPYLGVCYDLLHGRSVDLAAMPRSLSCIC